MPTGERKVYSFKSVGKTEEDVQEERAAIRRRRPIGIRTPVRISEGGEDLFEMHFDNLSNIKDNFRNLLLTNHGERLGLQDFGANLRPLVFELGNEDFDAEAIRRIGAAISKYMPFIEPVTFEPFKNQALEPDLARVGIRITYAVPQITNEEQAIEVILHAGG